MFFAESLCISGKPDVVTTWQTKRVHWSSVSPECCAAWSFHSCPSPFHFYKIDRYLSICEARLPVLWRWTPPVYLQTNLKNMSGYHSFFMVSDLILNSCVFPWWIGWNCNLGSFHAILRNIPAVNVISTSPIWIELMYRLSLTSVVPCFEGGWLFS